MERYKELANRTFEYFTKSDVFQVFDRPGRPDTPDIRIVSNMKQRALCNLRVLRGQQQTVVIATEIADNPGTSITNGSCELATKAVSDFSLDPGTTRFIEHYGQESYDNPNPNEPDHYDEVSFTWQEKTATRPRWRALQP